MTVLEGTAVTSRRAWDATRPSGERDYNRVTLTHVVTVDLDQEAFYAFWHQVNRAVQCHLIMPVPNGELRAWLSDCRKL